MRKVNEIFYSLQGEGHHTGYPSVFIRFSGCNLQCPFCDTDHSEGIMMSDDDIVHAVNLYTSSWVVLTGGEPALHIDTEFINLLKRATGKKIAIETNGTIPLPEGIDWVTISPKGGICGEEAPVKAVKADELKVIDMGQDLEPYFQMPCLKKETLMYLQPCYIEDSEEREANRLRTVGRVLADPRWTLSVQLHRFLNIP
ncbi:MAG: 7-carboxy-7-deazaguanine synthase QueE [Prevotella sp.]|nr:7-carboxy-7-deazaguanine synthase QueE [Prevotella sp.]MCM1476119.1 7-carboxy-7-deazaguanine synthase QueE [Muribaculaceae bacterium]